VVVRDSLQATLHHVFISSICFVTFNAPLFGEKFGEKLVVT